MGDGKREEEKIAKQLRPQQHHDNERDGGAVPGNNHTRSESGENNVSGAGVSCVVRLHGLPYLITEESIRKFFSDFELATENPILHFSEGLHRGTGFVRLRRAEDVDEAVRRLHRQHIDLNRYVELSVSSEEDRQKILEEQEQGCKLHVVRLRGLPFTSTEEDVREFMKSVRGVERVDICRDVEGRNSGDAFIQLSTEDDVEEAKQLHMKGMGTRYIEVLHSTVYDRDAILRAASLRARRDRRTARTSDEAPLMAANNYGGVGAGAGMPMMSPEFFNPAVAPAYMGLFPPVPFGGEMPMGAYDRGGMHAAPPLFPMFPPPAPLMAPRPPSPYVVRIRGLPYAATEETIADFFDGVSIPQQGVHMVYNEQSMPTGEAFVELEKQTDVLLALRRNGALMGNRYIEVFQSSASAMQRLGCPSPGMMGFAPYPMHGIGMMQ